MGIKMFGCNQKFPIRIGMVSDITKTFIRSMRRACYPYSFHRFIFYSLQTTDTVMRS